ncbi:MAG: hypothetical protein ACTSU5_14425 [Promethearchaeota archaeon]
MKATLTSRKDTRLKWFELKDVPFRVEWKLEVIYYPSNVEDNAREYTPKFHYVFLEVARDLPQSDIIIFQDELPTAYARTSGTRGNKFATEPQDDPSVSVTDRIVELVKGKEKITREPPAYPDPRVKEIEVREREDVVKRKLTFKNDDPEGVEVVEFKLVETKDVRYIGATPAPTSQDKPEYTWTFPIEGEGTYAIELELKTLLRKTFEIEREREPRRARGDEFQVQEFEQGVL